MPLSPRGASLQVPQGLPRYLGNVMEPTFTMVKKTAHRCTAGHEWETDPYTMGDSMLDWLVVHDKHYCIRCILDKLIELGIGQKVV